MELGVDFDVINSAARLGDGQAVGAKAFDMEFDRLLDFPLAFLDGVADGNAARQVRNICRVVALPFLDHHGVTHARLHHLSPACLRILFSVAGCKSLLGFPGTVTRPGLLGCLNWRWLPRITTCTHLSSRRISRISATFTPSSPGGKRARVAGVDADRHRNFQSQGGGRDYGGSRNE